MKLLKHPTVSLLLKFGFAGAILFYMVVSGRLDLAVVKTGFSQWQTVVTCLCLLMVTTLISIWRWGLLLRGQGLNFPLPQVLRYGLIGCFFNTTMPGAVSGDLIKAWYVVSEHKGQQKTPIFAAILLDRVMGVFGLVSVAGIALIASWSFVWSVPAMHGVAFTVLFLVLGMLAFFSLIMLSVWGPFRHMRRGLDRFKGNKLMKVVLKGYDGWMSYREVPSILLRSLLVSMVGHFGAISAVVLCARALGEVEISAVKYFVLVPLGLLTTAVPVAPAGLGVGHVAFGSLFGLVGSAHGAEIFTLFVSFQILVNLTGVFFYLGSAKKPDMSLDGQA